MAFSVDAVLFNIMFSIVAALFQHGVFRTVTMFFKYSRDKLTSSFTTTKTVAIDACGLPFNKLNNFHITAVLLLDILAETSHGYRPKACRHDVFCLCRAVLTWCFLLLSHCFNMAFSVDATLLSYYCRPFTRHSVEYNQMDTG